MQLSNQYPQFVTPLLESTFKQIICKFNLSWLAHTELIPDDI